MGQYRILRRIACGGMSEVFLGKLVGDDGSETPVAIKRISAAAAEGQQAVDAFLREARLCVQLVHPNVVQVRDVGVGCGQPFLVLELVDGEALRKVLGAAKRARSVMRPGEALHVVACVADALTYAYEAPGPDGAPLRVVHGDVNPSNILISTRGEVKLGGFGIARAAEEGQAAQGKAGKGSLGHGAPEQLGGGEARHASDVFQAGLLLFELLSGRPLFAPAASAAEAQAQLAAHDEAQISIPAGSPAALLPLLRCSLARNPKARYANARELSEALRDILTDRRLRLGPAQLAARMAALFPGRLPIGGSLSGGALLRPDAQPFRAVAAAIQEPPPAGPPASGPSRPVIVAARAVAAAIQEPPPDGEAAAGPPRPVSSAARPATPQPGSVQPAASAPPRPAGPRRRLGELLVEGGLLTPAQLRTLLLRQRQEGGKLGELAISLDLIDARRVLGTLAKQLGTLFAGDERLLQSEPPRAVLARFPEEAARRHQALPLEERDGWLLVAMVDPADLRNLDEVRFRLGSRLRPVLCTAAGLRQAIARVYRGSAGEPRSRQPDPSEPLELYTVRMVELDPGERSPAPGAGP